MFPAWLNCTDIFRLALALSALSSLLTAGELQTLKSLDYELLDSVAVLHDLELQQLGEQLSTLDGFVFDESKIRKYVLAGNLETFQKNIEVNRENRMEFVRDMANVFQPRNILAVIEVSGNYGQISQRIVCCKDAIYKWHKFSSVKRLSSFPEELFDAEINQLSFALRDLPDIPVDFQCTCNAGKPVVYVTIADADGGPITYCAYMLEKDRREQLTDANAIRFYEIIDTVNECLEQAARKPLRTF